MSGLQRMLARVLMTALVAGLTVLGLAAPASAAYGSITGTVTGPTGYPALGIGVSVLREEPDGHGGSTWTYLSSDSADDSGRYEVWVPAGSSYRVVFSPYEPSVYVREYYGDSSTPEDGTPVTVLDSAVTTGIDAQLAVEDAGEVSGRVTGTYGLPVAGVWVTLLNPPTEHYDYWTQETVVKTAPDGTYSAFVEPGTYRVSFDFHQDYSYPRQYYPNAIDVDSAADVEVTDGGSVKSVDARLYQLGRIYGRLTAAETGKGVAGGEVEVYANAGTTAMPDWQVVAATDVNTTGSYSVAVFPGTYRVRFLDANGMYLPEFHEYASSVGTATDVVLPPDASAYLSLRLTRKDAPLITSLVAPLISGSPRVNGVLYAGPGSWSPAAKRVTYQWHANGVAISGATGSSFVPSVGLLGQKISVVTTAVTPGRLPASRSSSPTTPVYAKSRLTARVAKHGSTVRFRIKVEALGLGPATGKIRVYRNSVRIKKVLLVDGKARVRLKNQPDGRWRYTVRYFGPSFVTQSAKTFRIAV